MESLQEQLLKAGLVDKNRANKVKKDKQKQSKVARNTAAKAVSKKKTVAQQEQALRAERDRELNLQKQKQIEQKAAQAQIKHIKQQLSLGRLAIVRLVLKSERLFEIVPAAIAAKIAQRDEHAVVQLNEKVDTEHNEDDPYADYQIPDDLTW
jgi:uncharacterized protein YaiL (DUF2058 family)